jgi:hypothetical protein
MYTVKVVADVRYVLYQWKNVKWGAYRDLYFVRPKDEQGFINYIISNTYLILSVISTISLASW